MASAIEGAESKGNLASALVGGLDVLSANDEVTFTQYIRLVLPLDGFVFWVKADLLSQSAIFNAMGFNAAQFGEDGTIAASAPTVTVKGSLHYSTIKNQNESETESVSTVIFTAESPIQQFNNIGPDTLWIGEYDGDNVGFDGPITFAFSQRGRYYKQSDLYHYSGTIVLPAFKAQLITGINSLTSKSLIVSNSLPAWLRLSNYDPPYDNGINCHLSLYPSFLVPDNLLPPYGVIHIDPDAMESLQSAPVFDSTLSQFSLSQDKVRVTLYGLDNAAAMSFLAAFLQYSYDYDFIGLSNMPVIKDAKRTAAELSVIAQKKYIDFVVTYNQFTMRTVARQMFEKLFNNYYPQPLTATGFVPPAP